MSLIMLFWYLQAGWEIVEEQEEREG